MPASNDCVVCHKPLRYPELAIAVVWGSSVGDVCHNCQDKADEVVIEDHDGWVLTADMEHD